MHGMSEQGVKSNSEVLAALFVFVFLLFNLSTWKCSDQTVEINTGGHFIR